MISLHEGDRHLEDHDVVWYVGMVGPNLKIRCRMHWPINDFDLEEFMRLAKRIIGDTESTGV